MLAELEFKVNATLDEKYTTLPVNKAGFGSVITQLAAEFKVMA